LAGGIRNDHSRLVETVEDGISPVNCRNLHCTGRLGLCEADCGVTGSGCHVHELHAGGRSGTSNTFCKVRVALEFRKFRH